MLAYIQGSLAEIQEDAVVLDHQGMGYLITISAMDRNSLPPIGETVKLHIHMNIREDDISLYGFLSKDALQLFRLLISVSGIGPKVGMSILSALTVHDIQMAVLSGDVKAITQANGVGTKSAQRVIMELKDKIDLESMSSVDHQLAASDILVNETDSVSSTAMALVSLGYSQFEAMQAIRKVEQAEDMTPETLLKAALKKLI